MSHASCITFLLLAVALPGQTAAGTTAAAPHVLIETVGPDGWRQRLGPTNLGNLLASERGRTLWEPHALPLLGYWQQLIGEPPLFAAARERLFGYGGHVRVAIWAVDDGGRGFDSAQAAIVLEADGRTDLAALAADVRQLQEQLPGQWLPRTVGERAIELRQHGADSMSAPIVTGTHLLLVTATKDHFDAALSRALAFAATSSGKPPAPLQPALRVDVDLATLIGLSTATVSKNEQAMLQALGMRTLGRLVGTITNAGPRVQIELDQEFTHDERGLFAALCPSTPEVPGLLRFAAANRGSFKAGRFDWTALHDAVLRGLEGSGEGSVDELRAKIAAEVGIDVRDDLLAHATDELFVHVSDFSDIDRLSDVTWIAAVRLQKPDAFRASLKVLMPQAKPFLSRERTTPIEGVELERYGNMFGYDLWMGVGEGMFLLAGGRDAEDRLAALLKAAKTGQVEPGTPTAVAMPKPFDELRRFLPPGTNSLAESELGGAFSLPTELWLGLVMEMLPRGPIGNEGPEQEQLEAVAELLRQHNLMTIRSASGYANRHWRWRMFW